VLQKADILCAIYTLKGRESLLSKLWVSTLISKPSQHSLPVFQVSLILSYVGGMVLDQAGHTPWGPLIVNLADKYRKNKRPFFIDKKSTAGRVSCQARQSSSWNRGIFGPLHPRRANAKRRSNRMLPVSPGRDASEQALPWAWLSSARGAKFRGILASHASEGQGGGSAQGDEPDRIGYRFGIRPFGIDQMAAPVSGAVLGWASRDARGSWQLREDIRWRR
jgi:hypothetical protein